MAKFYCILFCLFLSLDHADYYLLHEAPSYTEYMQCLRRKISLTKVVIEAVMHDPHCGYEKLAAIVQVKIFLWPYEVCD